jgi:7-carboxy-7-deazaguanine synthase
MFTNTQPREAKDKSTHSKVEMVQVWQTIQGEGPFVGTPAIFIRLAGCNLACAYCDTDYTTNRRLVDIHRLVDECLNLVTGELHRNADWNKPALVVLTGGEPFRQHSVSTLATELIMSGFMVQIETNGTFYDSEMPYDRLTGEPSRLAIVVSPKAPAIHQRLQPHVLALKYVLAADSVSPHDGLPTKVLGSPYAIARPWAAFKGDIFIQPEDHHDPTRNKQNIDAAVRSCMKFGYRLCLQTHKIIGVE